MIDHHSFKVYGFNGVSLTSLNVIYLKMANVIDHFVCYCVYAVSLYTVAQKNDLFLHSTVRF